MQMNHKVNGNFEKLYPKTLADNVSLNDGRTVQEYKEENDSRFPEQIPLWEGNVSPSENDSITISKPLSRCATGWILVWKRVNKSEQYQYTHIPKIFLNIRDRGATRSTLGNVGTKVVHKYYYISDTQLEGHGSNEDADNKDIELIGVYEY